MKRVIFTKDSSKISYGTSNIKIEFTEDMAPVQAAEFLIKELKQWNNLALSDLKKITIE